MAKHTITLEVDSGVLFDMLHQLQQAGATDWAAPFGDRMASLLMAPTDNSFLDSVGLALYGVTLKSVTTE